MPPISSVSPPLSPTAAAFDPHKKLRSETPPARADGVAKQMKGQLVVIGNGSSKPIGTLKATPGSGAALFSTEDGLRPHRPVPGPPFPPFLLINLRFSTVLGVGL
jgi:hypothetical protein